MLDLRDYEEEILEPGFFYCDCGELLQTNGDEDIECFKCDTTHKIDY